MEMNENKPMENEVYGKLLDMLFKLLDGPTKVYSPHLSPQMF